MGIERKLVAASLYIQGRGAISQLGENARRLGTKAYLIGGRTALSITEAAIRESLGESGVGIVVSSSDVKDCTHATIDRLVENGKEARPDFVVGVGGGRAVDTAKAVAWKLSIPAVTIGTQCATNADGSAEFVVYTDDHEFLEAVILPDNPAIVVVDTDVIASAPVKYLVWGMGDALTAKFEAEAHAEAMKRKGGPVPTNTSLALANATFESLMKHGKEAIDALGHGEHTDAVDEVIEAVKLSSAIAFENTGCALAHALHNGLTKTGTVRAEHGEIVAYGTIVQAVYEGRPDHEIRRIVDWCESVGLPTRLDMICDHDADSLKKAVDYACNEDANAESMPERPVPSSVIEAIDRAEREF